MTLFLDVDVFLKKIEDFSGLSLQVFEEDIVSSDAPDFGFVVVVVVVVVVFLVDRPCRFCC